MSELRDLPVVTVEQVIRFRGLAMSIEKERDTALCMLKAFSNEVAKYYRTHPQEVTGPIEDILEII